MKAGDYYVRFTPDEIAALLSALEAFDVDPPVVPDLAVYYDALAKLEAASKDRPPRPDVDS